MKYRKIKIEHYIIMMKKMPNTRHKSIRFNGCSMIGLIY